MKDITPLRERHLELMAKAQTANIMNGLVTKPGSTFTGEELDKLRDYTEVVVTVLLRNLEYQDLLK